MADTFTVFGKIGDAMEYMDESDRREFSYALMMYGLYGTPPELPRHLMMAFTLAQEDIDHSKAARQNGSRGGRGNKKAGVKTPLKTTTETSSKTQLSESIKGGLKTPLEAPLQKAKANTIQYSTNNTVQSNTEQGSEEGSDANASSPAPKKSSKRFSKPKTEEVAEYIREKGYTFDARQFVDYYESNGWRVGKSPMKDWKAAVRNWARHDSARTGQETGARFEMVRQETPEERLRKAEEAAQKWGLV